jgi:hypothetical protein
MIPIKPIRDTGGVPLLWGADRTTRPRRCGRPRRAIPLGPARAPALTRPRGAAYEATADLYTHQDTACQMDDFGSAALTSAAELAPGESVIK